MNLCVCPECRDVVGKLLIDLIKAVPKDHVGCVSGAITAIADEQTAALVVAFLLGKASAQVTGTVH